MNFKIVIKFFGIGFFVLALYYASLYFLRGMIRYNALLFFIKGQGKKRKVCNSLILIWFSDAFVLLWVMDMLSILEIKSLVQNTHILSFDHLIDLPNKVVTKTWWRLLKKRKPTQFTLHAMQLLMILAFYHFWTSYFTLTGGLLWQLQYWWDFLPCYTYHSRLKKAWRLKD